MSFDFKNQKRERMTKQTETTTVAEPDEGEEASNQDSMYVKSEHPATTPQITGAAHSKGPRMRAMKKEHKYDSAP